MPACKLYVAADPMHGLVTPLSFFKGIVSILKIIACLLEFRWYWIVYGDAHLRIENALARPSQHQTAVAFVISLLLMYRISRGPCSIAALYTWEARSVSCRISSMQLIGAIINKVYINKHSNSYAQVNLGPLQAYK